MKKHTSHLLLFLLCIWGPFAKSFSQNVGIGTTTPTKGRLEVYGAVGTTSAIFGGDGAGVSLQRSYPAIGYNQYYLNAPYSLLPGTGLVQYLDMPSGSLVFDGYASVSDTNQMFGGQTRRITIRQNGNVSLNAFEQNASLYVGYTGTSITPARFRGTTYHTVFGDRQTGQTTQHTYISAGKNGGHVFINDELGNANVIIGGGNTRVGINSADPTAVLEIKQVAGRGLVQVAPVTFQNWGFTVNHVAGETGSDLWVYYNEGYKGNFFHVDGLYYKQSDRRVKTNIHQMPSVLDRVMAMRPVQYEMKQQNGGHIQSIGFIAQEVRPLFPELTEVLEGEEHGYKGIKDLHTMNYDGLGPIAVKAIQEQQVKIKQLRQRNDALRKRIEAAEKAMNKNF